jgi:hypothetical protein
MPLFWRFMTDIKITTMTYDEVTNMYFDPPATFYIKNAMGLFVYMHTRSKEKAQEYVDKEYGKGKYKVQQAKIARDTKGKALTATGFNTRKCFAASLKELK